MEQHHQNFYCDPTTSTNHYYYQHQHHSNHLQQNQQSQENLSWCRKRQFHNSMKMLQQQQHQQLQEQNEEEITSVRCKSSTGNLFHSPMGVTDNSEQDYTKSPTVTNATDINTVEDSSWNQTNTFEDQNKRHHDEELTSMLQRYLDHPENLNDFHQKSPGQQSSDSGFSSSDSKSLPQLDFEDSSEDLSQLVDQVLSSIETQFPEYLHYVDHQISGSDGQNKKATYEAADRKAVAVTRPMPQNGRHNPTQQFQIQPTQQMETQQQQQQRVQLPQTDILNKPCKKRTVGVVEPRVVVKIPLAKVRGSFTESSNSIIRQQEQENLHPFIASSPEENASRKRRLDEDDDASQIELHQKKSKIEEPEKSLQPSTSSFTSSTTSSFLQQNSASDPPPRPPTSPQLNTGTVPLAASIATSTTTPNIWARRSVSISNNTQNETDIKDSYTTTTTINPRQNQADEPFVVYNYMESLPSFTNLKLDPTSAKDQSLEEDLPKLCLQQQQQQQHENKIAIKEEGTEDNNKVSSPSPQNVSANTNQLEEDITDDVDSRQSSAPSSPTSSTISTATSTISSTSSSSSSNIDKNNKINNNFTEKTGEIKLPSPPPQKILNIKAKVTVEPENDGKWMYCQVPGCHFWTRKQVRMDRHEKSHVPGDDKFYQCPECQLKICSLSKLLRHDRKFHTGFKDYECKICEAEVTDIAVHMRVHRTEKQFTCHVCKLQFRHKNSLVRHLFQHSGERPFRCQSCESGFTSINRLKEHIKKKHPNTAAAQSIMDHHHQPLSTNNLAAAAVGTTPNMGQPMGTPISTPSCSTMVCTPATQTSGAAMITTTTINNSKSKYTPIAPAPAKITTATPTTFMLPTTSPTCHPNLPILTQGPNGTMILVSANPTPAFATTGTPTFMLPTAAATPTPLYFTNPTPFIYGMPSFFQPQVQNLSAAMHNLSGAPMGTPIGQTMGQSILSTTTATAPPPTIVSTTPTTMATPSITSTSSMMSKHDEITVLNEKGESHKFDILERAILEIPNINETVSKH